MMSCTYFEHTLPPTGMFNLTHVEHPLPYHNCIHNRLPEDELSASKHAEDFINQTITSENMNFVGLYFIILFNIVLFTHLCLGFARSLFPSDFSQKLYMH